MMVATVLSRLLHVQRKNTLKKVGQKNPSGPQIFFLLYNFLFHEKLSLIYVQDCRITVAQSDWAQDFTSRGKDPCLDLWAKDFTS